MYGIVAWVVRRVACLLPQGVPATAAAASAGGGGAKASPSLRVVLSSFRRSLWKGHKR